MIETSDDVLAVRITGKITGEDLRDIMDRLDVTMAIKSANKRPLSRIISRIFFVDDFRDGRPGRRRPRIERHCSRKSSRQILSNEGCIAQSR